MRDIKFRGYDPVTQEWVYGYYTKTTFGSGFSDSIVVFDGTCTMPVKVDPDSVGQYTGLTNKNGVEIYEGDIIEFTQTLFNTLPSNFPKKRSKVGWDKHRAGFDVDITAAGRINIEIIGNIHQNPELMEIK